ncbi:MAG TPA: cyclic nucleotide-binding domain-containing protein [Mesorhizobium sp.]|jgi:CRP-like cAMP-binding protein|nr:cyclic nucleotide-binding domain-containing protein [Mesorhizobium sp.]
MALDDDIRILSGVPLFDGFAPEQLRLLAFGAERVALEAGDTLFSQGERAAGAFILVSGALALSREEDGVERPAGRVARPGALLGELALIVETARPTHARAEQTSVLLRLDRKAFRRILEEYPELAVRLHGRLSRQLVELAREVERLAPRFSE